jgi:chromosome segregation ATPase
MILAIQDRFPSPFYLLDEVDAFLDAKISDNLGRLLQMRSKQTGSQFIVVSHKPELQMHADGIAALSFDGEAIGAITMHFHR